MDLEKQNIYVDSTSIIDDGAKIGKNCKIWHWVHISSGAVIGDNCSFGQNVFVGNQVKIGNNVKVQNNVSIYDNIILENNVFCGPSMVFTNVINPRSKFPRKNEYKTTLVKEGATLGANCTILCGIIVGERFKPVKHIEIGGFEIQGPNSKLDYPKAKANRDWYVNNNDQELKHIFHGRGIAVWGGNNINIHNNKVYDTPNSGIRVNNSDYCRVSYNEVFNTTFGLLMLKVPLYSLNQNRLIVI